jgi:hypothetical protein
MTGAEPDESGPDEDGILSSNPDSFIEEVTEAVRRDRLFAAFRKYGWIGILVILLIVGWSAWLQYAQHRHNTKAQAFGDKVLAALAITDAPGRREALDRISPADSDQKVMLDLLTASTAADADKLAAIYADTKLPVVYRHLAEFRRLLLVTDLSPDERAKGLEELTAPGAPFRLLAEEQLALIDIAKGDTDKAVERLKSIADDNEAGGALRRRAQQLIVAVGGTPDK